EVYSIAELLRRQRGGAAVVLGALSPRTRNAQVALYQSGDVDFIVATDAIGMGLNLDVDHVAFSATRKFDGQNHRNLTPSELSQIAGRAGRHMNDGTFGVTGAADPLDSDTIERLETHNFESVRTLQWRNRDLDFRTLEGLRHSLREMPNLQRLVRARAADDVVALETVCADRDLAAKVIAPAAVARLWEVCQIPDYRKISGQSHAELVSTIFGYLIGPDEHIPEDWFAKQVSLADRVDGDLDTLSNRIAHIRTWTFVSNRSSWLKDPEHWQGKTREIEDRLSDALHEQLTQRFVDQRTSALMKGMRDKDELHADIAADGAINVENHFVGRLKGFLFQLDPGAEGIQGKATRTAASQVLARELSMRARRVAAAQPDALSLNRRGRVLWREEEIGQLEATDDPLKPSVSILADEYISAPDREKVQARLEAWVAQTIADKLKPLVEISNAEDVTGLAKGIAFRMRENLGVLRREVVAEEIKSLDQNARSQLRKYGVRFGAFNIYFPILLKPAAAELVLTLWALKNASTHGMSSDALPEAPRAGLTSFAPDPACPEPFYRAYGYHVCGPRAVRLDMLERLADLIRPLLAWRSTNGSMPPKGATGDGGFTVIPEMMSLLGCSPDELGGVLKALGFRLDRRPIKQPAPAAIAAAEGEVVASTASEAEQPAIPADAAAPETVSASEASAATAPVPDAAPAVASETPAEAAPESAPPTAAPEAAAPEPTGATAAPAEAEIKYEDVWRPRRHQRTDRRPERRDNRNNRQRGGDRSAQSAPSAQPEATAAQPPTTADSGVAATEPATQAKPQRRDDRRPQGKDRTPDRGRDREHRRGGGGGQGDRHRREDRRKAEVHTAAPPRRGGIDPDSPFAALGALREELAKRSKESGA
ncbi:MAG: helicase-related protein, partial [Hyphomicrobium sp.]